MQSACRHACLDQRLFGIPSQTRAPCALGSYKSRQRSCSGSSALGVRVVTWATQPAELNGIRSDLVLSSGFMAFAYHSGFLMAVEQTGLEVTGVMGTSSGALAGSLYCAGMSPAEVAAELDRVRPIEIVRPCFRPWRGGILSLHKVVERLRLLLPATFEELDKDFAVGVVSWSGQYEIINSGPLPEAVAASIAIPFVFSAVDIPGRKGGPFQDGGMHDRVGLQGWRGMCAARGSSSKQPPPPATVHLIARSSPFSGTDDTISGSRVVLVKSPRSKGGFLSLGDFDLQVQIARKATLSALEGSRSRLVQRVSA